MAQTYKFGNGTWATKKGSTLAYSDTNNAFKPLPFSFERNSIGTRVNKEGLIEVVGKDIPRIDYTDSSEGALLLENSSTNLITYSEAFDNAYWTKSGSSVVSGFVSPSGDTSAFKLTEDTSSNHQMYRAISGTSKTLSFFAKSDGRDWIAINCGSLTYFNVALGIVGTVASGSSATIESMPNGWFRCSVTETSAAYGADFSLSKDGTTTSYQGDGTSGVLLWGMQLESGNPSSYIPTNGSTVQRAAETCNESGNSEVFNDSEGVLFVDTATLQEGVTERIISLSDETPSNNIYLSFSGSINTIYYLVVSGGVTQFVLPVIVSQKETNKLSIKYKSNSISFWLNGFKVGETSVANTPSGLKNISFGYPINSLNFYGKTKEIAYYDTALTDAELETLTSYRSLNEMVTELNLNAL